MTNLLKKSFAFLLTAVLCLCLAACGKTGDKAPDTLEGIVPDESINYDFEDIYDEYLGFWYPTDADSLMVTENDGKYLYELYDAYNEVISSGQLQYMKEYRCMYACCEQDGIAYRCRIQHEVLNGEDNDTLCIDYVGVFARGESKFEVIGDDWRTWGIVCDSGTVTRGGEDTTVLVCVHSSDANFYYDEPTQVIFGYVEYPITLESDAWGAYRSIDFSDRSGDGNSDVAMQFNDGGKELLMVWFWDAESEEFVYQEAESQLGEEEGQGDLIPDGGNAVLVLKSDELPFANMKTLESEVREDGTYYYADATEDGQITAVNTVLQNQRADDGQTPEEYAGDCALALSEADAYDSLTVEKNDAYTAKMSYPVYIVTYTAGKDADTCEWTVFVMETDSYTYLCGFCAAVDAADDVKSVYEGFFAGLQLSDEEPV